jgi:hypothetical protein
MSVQLRNRKGARDASAAARVALLAIRDATDVFPPIKSVVAAVIILWDMSQVSIFSRPFFGLLRLLYL